MGGVSARLTPEVAALQLSLVDRFTELGLGTRSQGVHRLTNFHRRLGLGSPTDPPSNQTWLDLLATLEEAPTPADRVAAVTEMLEALPAAVPEHVAQGWPTVGAFSIQRSGNVARTHFYSTDQDDLSPLHPTKLDQRRQELTEVLAMVCADHPEINRVAGGSWLYSTRSYASLFPVAHAANGVVRRGRDTFRGMSHWGQFVDHRGDLRPDLVSVFAQRVRAWEGSDPCGLFPIPTLEVSSPLDLFAGNTR